MIFFLAQSRFPAPEFENYSVPEMNLEETIQDTTGFHIAVLIVFLIISGIVFYRLRSRRLMLLLSACGLVVFGYIFTACPCPVGMFQNIAESIATGTAVSPVFLLLFAIPLICALFFGRLFCGSACPIGAVQELLHWKTVPVPRPLDRVLRMIPILLLLLFTVMASTEMGYKLCELEPYHSIFILKFSLKPAILAGVFLLTGLFISRPFCRYFCPYGVLLRFCTHFSLNKPQITAQECIACKLCEQGCPNGVIIPPEPYTDYKVQFRGQRRFSMLIASVPLLLFFGGMIGYFAAPILISQHSEVCLLREIRSGEMTDAVKAFDQSGTPLPILEQRVIVIGDTITVRTTLAGMFFAGCVIFELIMKSRPRREDKEYRIDPTLCFCCARCYPTCPLNKRPISDKENRS